MDKERDSMNETATIIQERLERLEAGESLAVCLAGLTAEQGELLQAAVTLRSTPMPVPDRTAVATHRAAVLSAAQVILTPKPAALTTLFARFQTLWTGLNLHKGPALALASLAVILMCGVGLFGWWQVSSNRAGALIVALPVGQDQTAGDAAGHDEGVIITGEVVAVGTEHSPAVHQALFPLISTPLVSGPDKAVLHNLRGLVEMQVAGGAWTAVTQNTELPAGSRIRTGRYSRAELAFYDGSKATIGPNSELSLDQVDALPPEAGFRTVILTLWAGSSDHQVQFRNDGGSRYEVKTKTGSGIARGTAFRVVVNPDGRARYTVREGKVDVSNGNQTVVVIAGQTTSFGASEPPTPPQFTVTGTGVISQIGDTWIIAGQPFAVNEQTTIVGDPAVGDMAFVEGYLDSAGELVATLIQKLDDSPENQFALTGPVEEMEETAWVVAGQPISITADSEIDPNIALADMVRVQGVILRPGSYLVALTIERLASEEGFPFAFAGVVQAILPRSWTISDITIAIDDETDVEDGIDVGDTVQVEGVILADDSWLAHEIKRMTDDDPTFTFTGQVMSTNPWLVAGISFEVADWASIESGIAAGDTARASGIIQEDGTWLATEIILIPDDGILQITLVGVADNAAPWIISGLPIGTDEVTVIEEGIEVGDVVQVTASIDSDDTWLATQIKRLEDDMDEGCVVVMTDIVAISGDAVVLNNGETIIPDEGIVIDGELEAGSVVAIVACVTEDGTIDIVSTTHVYTPPPTPVSPTPAAGPAPGPSDVAVICHKPGTPAEQTITLLESALSDHLGHGDTLGPCP